MRVPVTRTSGDNAIEQLRMVLCECHSLCPSSRTTSVEGTIRILSIVCCSQSFCRRGEQANGIVDPSIDLFLVVQVRQIYARLTTAAVVVRRPMARISSSYCETHPGIQLCQHAGVVDSSSHSSIADSHESVIVLQSIW